jgi:hypothetical protein
MPELPRSRRLLLAVGFLVLLVTGYLGLKAWLDDDTPRGSSAVSLSTVRAEPHVVFQDVRGFSDDPDYSRVALAPIQGTRKRVFTRLVCQRVYYAAGRGLCLGAVGPGRLGDLLVGQAGFRATITDSSLRPRRRLPLPGRPTWARISADGRYGAATVEVEHGPHEEFPETFLLDMDRGRLFSDLVTDFALTRNGKAMRPAESGVSCVTFAKRGRFYASLESSEKTYLIEGNVATRRARIVRANAKCPSISPDGRRIVYTRQVRGRPRLHLLDLRSSTDIQLAEHRPIDDQVEWLDDHRILYGYDSDTWELSVDGRSPPRKFLDKAVSPAVVRNPGRL